MLYFGKLIYSDFSHFKCEMLIINADRLVLSYMIYAFLLYSKLFC